jgi:hypothetical protein
MMLWTAPALRHRSAIGCTRTQRYEVCRGRTQALGIGIIRSIVDVNVAALDPSQFTERLDEKSRVGLFVSCRHEHADPAGVILSASTPRPPCRSKAERRDELPSSDADCHSPRPLWGHARSNEGKNITPQNGGLWPSRAPLSDDWRDRFQGDSRRDCHGSARQKVTHLDSLPYQFDALRKIHSITSSARSRMEVGTSNRSLSCARRAFRDWLCQVSDACRDVLQDDALWRWVRAQLDSGKKETPADHRSSREAAA